MQKLMGDEGWGGGGGLVFLYWPQVSVIFGTIYLSLSLYTAYTLIWVLRAGFPATCVKSKNLK